MPTTGDGSLFLSLKRGKKKLKSRIKIFLMQPIDDFVA